MLQHNITLLEMAASCFHELCGQHVSYQLCRSRW